MNGLLKTLWGWPGATLVVLGAWWFSERMKGSGSSVAAENAAFAAAGITPGSGIVPGVAPAQPFNPSALVGGATYLNVAGPIPVFDRQGNPMMAFGSQVFILNNDSFTVQQMATNGANAALISYSFDHSAIRNPDGSDGGVGAFDDAMIFLPVSVRRLS